MQSEELAKKARLDVLKMVYEKKASFVGSDFSCIDILAVLYSGYIKCCGDPLSDDMVILSKGHAAGAWYAVLANKGIFPKKMLADFNENGSCMGVHSKRGAVPGIYASCGSLGQGLGMACGCALADKIGGKPNKTYVILGDGECNEGAIWEGFMFAARYQLNNLIAIVDRNGLQSYGTDEEVLNMGNMEEKFLSFHWNVLSINGHNHELINQALQEAARSSLPTIIIANTIKGKGVSEFENGVAWHYKWPDSESYQHAWEELMR